MEEAVGWREGRNQLEENESRSRGWGDTMVRDGILDGLMRWKVRSKSMSKSVQQRPMRSSAVLRDEAS